MPDCINYNRRQTSNATIMFGNTPSQQSMTFSHKTQDPSITSLSVGTRHRVRASRDPGGGGSEGRKRGARRAPPDHVAG